MRFAAIADIHGNCLALEAVLADIKRMGVDNVVNLGDHVGGPLEAARTADLLMDLGFASIKGNHDRMVVEKSRSELGLSDKAALDELTPRHLSWLEAMPKTLVFRGEVFMCHGTPASDESYWLERVCADGTVRMATQAEAAADAMDTDYPLILCGHTHTPRVVRLRDGRIIVNPGSIGLPAYDHDVPVPHYIETGTPHARYAVFEKTVSGWDVTFRHVAYDWDAMSALALRRGRNEWASGLATGWLKP